MISKYFIRVDASRTRARVHRRRSSALSEKDCGFSRRRNCSRHRVALFVRRCHESRDPYFPDRGRRFDRVILLTLKGAEKSWQVNKTVDKIADDSLTQPQEISMLWTIIIILVVLWLLGFIGHVGGSLIHLLLVIAVIVLVINLIQGRRL
jgi:hypothetical protein